mgnify:CR=1 FL=1
MILNDLFLEINQVFTRAYCARDGARPCRLRPLPCDWLLPKRRDIIRLLGNKDKWLSYVVILNREPQQRDLPMQGKCGFHFKIRILFNFFLSLFFYQSTNFHSALHSAWWPSHPSHIGAEPHGLAPGLWSNMVGHGKKNENYRCVHWFFEDQTFSILFPDNVCWMFDKNTLRSGNQPTFL